jgi:hypothetical protein
MTNGKDREADLCFKLWVKIMYYSSQNTRTGAGIEVLIRGEIDLCNPNKNRRLPIH